MKTLEEAGRLTAFTRTMAKQLGLIRGDLTLSYEGEVYLSTDAKSRNRILVTRMLQTYTRFQEFLKVLRNREAGELHVPVEKGQSVTLEKYMGIPGLSWIYFETILDLATQLKLVNWYAETPKPRNKLWVVYLVCSIATKNIRGSDNGSRPDSVDVSLGNETWNISFNTPTREQFSQAIWQDYLELTKYVARKPIFYSTLRNKVCHSLRMADSVFDTYALNLMSGDDKFRLVGAGGTLQFSRDSASMLKSLPPKTDRGEYIVYLKMDKRN